MFWQPGNPPHDYTQARPQKCTTCMCLLLWEPWIVTVHVTRWGGRPVRPSEADVLAITPCCSEECAQAGCAFLLADVIPGMEYTCEIASPK